MGPIPILNSEIFSEFFSPRNSSGFYYLLFREYLHDCVMQIIHLFILHNAIVQCSHSVSLLITSAHF